MRSRPASLAWCGTVASMTRVLKVMLLALVLLSGCGPIQGTPTPDEPSSDAAAAQQVLLRFFHFLSSRDFEKAVDLYGGSYATMVEHNPAIDPADHEALFKAACTINGAQCLEVRSARLVSGGSSADGDFTFVVEFSQPDGSRLSLGPCCGGTGDNTPPQTEFRFQVRTLADHLFKVMTPPVYLP